MQPSLHRPFRKVDEIPRDFNRAEIVQIVMTAAGEADEPFRLVRQRKQPFAKDNGYRGIERAMHHEQRNPDLADALVGVKPIPHQ